jgi:hypothetical protein
MKWFKHISDSLDDPFIFDLMTEFKSDGYVVFFGVIEIYSREFSKENGWKLVISLSYLHQKLRVSPSKVKKILLKIYKWKVSFEGNKVSIFIPKFTELLDEWTSRKIGSKSGVTPEILKRNTDKELDKELDTDMYKGNSAHVIKKEKRINFIIPSVDEIKTYCTERGNNIDCSYFFDYHMARDWKLKGGQKIKDWKAVIRTWERNNFDTTNKQGATVTRLNKAELRDLSNREVLNSFIAGA